MTTKLNGPLKRELEIDGQPYTLTITPDALKLAPKGRRNGHELQWKSIVGGEADAGPALNTSVRDAPESEPKGGPSGGP